MCMYVCTYVCMYVRMYVCMYVRICVYMPINGHHLWLLLCVAKQVKNFGRSGRTKYTHLVDQDTTVFDSAWTESTPLNLKFQTKGGGARQIFDKPSYKKRKMM